MKTLKYLTVAALISVLGVSCSKDEVAPDGSGNTDMYGSVALQFDNKVGSDDLVLNTTQYTNNTDTFTVTTFHYYISNIRLRATDNTEYSETESYHLVKAEDAASLQFTLANVPVKHYESITFMIGVDSARNCSGAQTGALDPVNGHFWSWNSGYIMAKFEGVSPQSMAAGNIVMYHIGGYTGVNNTIKTVTLPLATHANVTTSATPQIRLKADLAEWFSPNTVSFANVNTIHMPGANAKMIADNYENMISVMQVFN
jgi:hypothetical protein